MSDYFKDRAAADALAKSLLSDDEMRHIVSCSAPIPAGKNHELLTCREAIVVKSIRRATAKAAGVRMAALEAENAELLAALEDYLAADEIAEGHGSGIGGDARKKARAAIEKATGSAS